MLSTRIGHDGSVIRSRDCTRTVTSMAPPAAEPPKPEPAHPAPFEFIERPRKEPDIYISRPEKGRSAEKRGPE